MPTFYCTFCFSARARVCVLVFFSLALWVLGAGSAAPKLTYSTRACARAGLHLRRLSVLGAAGELFFHPARCVRLLSSAVPPVAVGRSLGFSRTARPVYLARRFCRVRARALLATSKLSSSSRLRALVTRVRILNKN